ncbi:MAG: chemotaxis protein CheD [Planctomycetota bacterium]|nr:chemotaxis protein CheD [Planctomycetota bacterium]
MNHFLLPEGRLEGAGRALAYGVHAMETLVNEIMQRGGERRRLKAKLFGAASVLTDFAGGRAVAERNQAFARGYLEAEGIELVAHKLGGERPLDVRFETHTGRAFVRDAGSDRRRATASVEAEYFRQISEIAAGKASPETTMFDKSTAQTDDILFEDSHE